jgi:hypothetical protein
MAPALAETIPATFALAALAAAALATIAAWAPRRLLPKLAAVAVFALFLPLGYAALVDLLSRPKPVSAAWWERRATEREATVLAGDIREDEAIYLWLELPGTPEPRAYRLPWDRNRARELQDALRAAGERGTGVKVRQPFGPPPAVAAAGGDPAEAAEEPMFYPEAQPPLPEKEPAPGEGPLVFRSAAAPPAALPPPSAPLPPPG